jgi:carbon storage regulator
MTALDDGAFFWEQCPIVARDWHERFMERRRVMLVLSRKIGERVLIGSEICITLVEVKGNRVKLGIEAPATVPVWRDELSDPHLGSQPPCSEAEVLVAD